MQFYTCEFERKKSTQILTYIFLVLIIFMDLPSSCTLLYFLTAEQHQHALQIQLHQFPAITMFRYTGK
jgi:hypothetical protein